MLIASINVTFPSASFFAAVFCHFFRMNLPPNGQNICFFLVDNVIPNGPSGPLVPRRGCPHPPRAVPLRLRPDRRLARPAAVPALPLRRKAAEGVCRAALVCEVCGVKCTELVCEASRKFVGFASASRTYYYSASASRLVSTAFGHLFLALLIPLLANAGQFWLLLAASGQRLVTFGSPTLA